MTAQNSPPGSYSFSQVYGNFAPGRAQVLPSVDEVASGNIGASNLAASPVTTWVIIVLFLVAVRVVYSFASEVIK